MLNWQFFVIILLIDCCLGASEPKHMAYMVRLGIWGPGSPFRDFSDFLGAVEKRGVGAMEIVAMDMKLRGMYIARQLSFQVSHIKFSLGEGQKGWKLKLLRKLENFKEKCYFRFLQNYLSTLTQLAENFYTSI